MTGKILIGIWIVMLCLALPGGDSYSELMDRAEKLTARRYEPNTRAFKIKSAELDEILDSEESREEKIRKLKAYIAELEKLLGQEKKPEAVKPAAPPDPLKAAVAAAESGDPDAMFRLGMIYWNGKLVHRSASTAVRWFRRAAAKDHSPARFMLAYAQLHGKGLIPDPKKAFAELKKLFDEGFAAAGLPLGLLYYEGKSCDKDYAAAVKCLKAGMTDREMCPADCHPEAILGRIYYSGGYGLAADPARAVEYLRQAENDPEARSLLGCLYLEGKAVPQDLPAALECFRFAMKHGNRPAGFQLGRMYHLGIGVKKDDPEAVRCLTPAADSNDPEAAFLLAEILADEKSPAKNPKNAFYYYRVAARNGSHEAACRCGLMLLSGTGVERDPAGAKQFLESAAKQGNVQAAFLCAGMEQEAKQPAKAAGYYRIAADGGHPEAIRIFASMALSGQGMKADPALGIRYLKKLADRKDVPALLQLAGLYESGIGPVQSDMDQAVRYYQQAAELGSAPAQARLAQIYFALGKYDLAEKYAALAEKQKNRDGLRILQQIHAKDKPADAARTDRDYLRELADSGDLPAIRQYGIRLYHAGKFPEAEKYLSKLPAERDPELLFMRGDIAYQRTDGKADPVLARQLLDKASQAGHTTATIRLGQMYQRGDGGRQDFRRALRYFMLAAAKKDPEAMYLTGSMYYNGEGVSADYPEAFRWFRMAAEKAISSPCNTFRSCSRRASVSRRTTAKPPAGARKPFPA